MHESPIGIVAPARAFGNRRAPSGALIVSELNPIIVDYLEPTDGATVRCGSHNRVKRRLHNLANRPDMIRDAELHRHIEMANDGLCRDTADPFRFHDRRVVLLENIRQTCEFAPRWRVILAGSFEASRTW